MKKVYKIFGLIFLFFIMLQSCKPADIYYSLSDNEKEVLSLDKDDVFKLKNIVTNEIITFTVVAKKFDFIQGGSNNSSMIPSGPRAAIYLERGILSFTDITNCYNGEISIMAQEEGGFLLRAYLGECFISYSDYYQYYNEFIPTTDVDGIEYQNSFILKSLPGNLFYSKEKGILKITDFEENIKFGIVE